MEQNNLPQQPIPGKGLIEQISAEQTLYNTAKYKMEALMHQAMKDFVIKGEYAMFYGKSKEELENEVAAFENIEVEKSEVDSAESTLEKLQVFEDSVILEPVMKNVEPGQTGGTFFNYRPDRVNDGHSNPDPVWAWANTDNHASMERCFKTCSPERWKLILKRLNNIL